MLISIAQAPVWKHQGHVCLACQRQRRVQTQQHLRQIRYNTHLAHTFIPPQPEEFINNFNDIGDNYSSPKRSRKATPVETKAKKQETGQIYNRDFDHIRASLQSRIDTERTSVQSFSRRKRAKKEAVQSTRRKQQNLEQLVVGKDGKFSGDSQKFVADLQRETRDTASRQDDAEQTHAEPIRERQTPTLVSESPENPSPRPMPTFIRRFDTLGSSPRKTDTVAVTLEEDQRIRESERRKTDGSTKPRPKRLRAKTSPSARGLGGPLKNSSYGTTQSGNDVKLAFGVNDAGQGVNANVVSFSSFRNADRISPDKPIPTSVTANPYGIREPTEQHARRQPPVTTAPSLFGRIKAMMGFKSTDETTTNSSEAGFQLQNSGQKENPTDSSQAKIKSQLDQPSAIDSSSAENIALGEGEVASQPFIANGPVATSGQQEDLLDLDNKAHARLSSLYSSRPAQEISERGASATNNVSGQVPTTASPRTAEKKGGPSIRKQELPPRSVIRYHSSDSPILNTGPSGLFRRHEANVYGELSTSPADSAAAAGTPSTTGSGPAGSGNDDPEQGSDNPQRLSLADATQKARPTRRARARRNSSAPKKVHQTEEPIQEEQPQEELSDTLVMSISPSQLHIDPLDIPQPHVPYLEYGLDRVLFNPGIYHLQDPASRVYNFDPYLQNIMPVQEFDFNSLKEYKTSSQDTILSTLAKDHGKKYIGSTSSMTSSLAHFHYLLSNWRPINLGMLSNDFVTKTTKTNMTEINRAPSAIFLRWKNGTYAIDADKEYDGATVLMLLGKSMELLLTVPKPDYERYRKSDPRQVPDEQKTAPESYQYTTMRDFLMRSQLDAYDPRLPGNGTFDLKTRAVVSVRMQAKEYEPMTGYEIFSLHGNWNSYEREYYDMMRSTMLKYMLQARMGRMSGIFVAYHNVKRIFGFQYMPMHDLDRALHGQIDPCLGDQEFRASLDMLNEVLNKATSRFPEQSLRIHFETQPEQSNGMPAALHVFAEPMAEDEIDRIQSSGKAKIAAFEREVMGKEIANESAQAKAPDGAAVSGDPDKPTLTPNQKLTAGSSESNADVDFLNTIEDASDEELKPLFYATIIVQSRVNGDIPSEDRPTDLKQSDRWDIDYILKEYEIGRHQWALYEDMKARRKVKFAEAREDEDEGDPESDGQDKRLEGYIQMLRGLSEKSREARIRLDEMDAGKEQVSVEVGLSREREKIEGVEDYMKWLYTTHGQT